MICCWLLTYFYFFLLCHYTKLISHMNIWNLRKVCLSTMRADLLKALWRIVYFFQILSVWSISQAQLKLKSETPGSSFQIIFFLWADPSGSERRSRVAALKGARLCRHLSLCKFRLLEGQYKFLTIKSSLALFRRGTATSTPTLFLEWVAWDSRLTILSLLRICHLWLNLSSKTKEKHSFLDVIIFHNPSYLHIQLSFKCFIFLYHPLLTTWSTQCIHPDFILTAEVATYLMAGRLKWLSPELQSLLQITIRIHKEPTKSIFIFHCTNNDWDIAPPVLSAKATLLDIAAACLIQATGSLTGRPPSHFSF